MERSPNLPKSHLGSFSFWNWSWKCVGCPAVSLYPVSWSLNQNKCKEEKYPSAQRFSLSTVLALDAFSANTYENYMSYGFVHHDKQCIKYLRPYLNSSDMTLVKTLCQYKAMPWDIQPPPPPLIR